MRKSLLAVIATTFLAGCAYSGVKQLDRVEYTGNDFNQLLAAEYKKYAMFEAYKMSDWKDAEYHADKAMAAGNGEMVMPSELAERHIPEFAVQDLSSARAKLMTALVDLKGIEGNAPLLAKAQASFDCWLEQQEENIQPNDIAECRVQFQKAMSMLNYPHVIVEETFRVFFDTNSAKVSEDAMDVIKQAQTFIGDKAGTSIVLTGATDTTGSAEYNKKLSDRRAQAVYDAMMQAGIPEHKVQILAEGEDNLLVETEDGVSEVRNRRVDIVIIR